MDCVYAGRRCSECSHSHLGSVIVVLLIMRKRLLTLYHTVDIEL